MSTNVHSNAEREFRPALNDVLRPTLYVGGLNVALASKTLQCRESM